MNQDLRQFLESQLLLEQELQEHLRELAQEELDEEVEYECMKSKHNRPSISGPELDRT